MANDNWPPGGEEPIDILDDDLLEETVLALDDDDGGFEEEATQIYRPEEHDDDGGFEEEATRVFDTSGGAEPEYDDESTRVWQTESSPAAAVPATAGGAYTTQLPRHGINELAASRPASGAAPQPSMVIAEAAASVPRKQVARPNASGAVPRRAEDDRQSKLLTAMIALAALALLSVFGVLLSRGGGGPTGTVAVMTTPQGAAVVLDGQRLALTTPTTLPDLELGRSYTLQLELNGYDAVTETLIVSEAIEQRFFELEAATGTVVVRTVPEGASVAVNGAIRGTSPVTVEGLDPTKAHDIVATLAGHEDATRSVTFTADGDSEELITLTLTPTGGTAVAAAEAGGTPAAGSGEGAVDAAPAAGVSAGATVTVGANGQLIGPDGQPILGPDGQPLTVLAAAAAAEEPEPEPEPVASSSDRSSSSRDSSESSRSSRSDDSARSSRSSRSSRSDSARDRPSSRSSRSAPPTRERPSATRPAPEPEPEPEPAGDGSISVQAVPYGQVWIDGRMVSPETPLIGHDLSAGVHRVKVYFVSLRSFSDERSVRIEAGQNRTVTFRAER